MSELVHKFQTVSLVFDLSTRFLRDACFSMWKSLLLRSEHYRKLCIIKMLKYRFKKMKLYKRSHLNAEIEMIEHEITTKQIAERKEEFEKLFEVKRIKRRSIRRSIRNSMVKNVTIVSIYILMVDMCM